MSIEQRMKDDLHEQIYGAGTDYEDLTRRKELEESYTIEKDFGELKSGQTSEPYVYQPFQAEQDGRFVLETGTITSSSLLPAETPDAPADACAQGVSAGSPSKSWGRKEILDTAAGCVLRDRQKEHGAPEQTFGVIAAMWSAFLDHPVTSAEVCAMMGLLKIARSKANPQNPDNWVDAAGYAACGGELAMQKPADMTAEQAVSEAMKVQELVRQDMERMASINDLKIALATEAY